MLRRALPVVLAAAAAVADSRGAYGLASSLLLAAVPCAAVAALLSFGEYLEHRGGPIVGTQTLLWALGLALIVLSCAARSPTSQMHEVPALASSALTACLALYALKALLALAPYARLALRPAKP